MKGVKEPPKEEILKRAVFLPPPKKKHIKKTLVFDLDETLVHCVDDPEVEESDVVLPVEFPNGERVEAGINVRPYMVECLKEAN
jgi:CTD small phosphatase-like protein 2